MTVKFYYLGLRLLLALLQRVLYVLTAGQLPPFASVAVVVRDGNKILLIMRRDGKGYGLPGGHLKLHETAEEAAHREVEEETGLRLENMRVVGILSGRRPGTWVRTLDVVFEGRVASGNLRSSREGRCEWVELAQVRDQLAFDYRKVLES
ncbi:MAG: NUDIX hydrolase [candidate division KSB1 bacterium]|nr:NUDIX hydrolase [candidate division KSB1 bacterium]MDZ7286666.1 NUDIX hydrolase [candidate division KSB1 bacterium]MDZ7299171.1 NUDIX hydrolase [candidate division KSB1 bacterium]MDZ7307019.1 NUDIX hydrolase [candidate division KSB1 bacterium]MDZ7350035.1 NUDIX hydrolase [candidate division KSB1 bacterium]